MGIFETDPTKNFAPGHVSTTAQPVDAIYPWNFILNYTRGKPGADVEEGMRGNAAKCPVLTWHGLLARSKVACGFKNRNTVAKTKFQVILIVQLINGCPQGEFKSYIQRDQEKDVGLT